jgi:hypothetical protein
VTAPSGIAAEKNAEEIHQAGPHDCIERLQGIRVNHRCDGIRSVMKSVRKLEGEDQRQARDQEADRSRQSLGEK